MAFQPSFVNPATGNVFDPSAKRIEIDEFVVDNVMTNLFLLALRAMQDKPLQEYSKDDWFSFYNLGAIHGYPLELWRGVKNTYPGIDADSGYYCTHGSTVFPTWHRCEINTFEQAVYREMELQAEQFSDSDGKSYFVDALKRFRLPYWDPVLPRIKEDKSISNDTKRYKQMFGMPEILTAPNVWVKDPKAGVKQIINPLSIFKYPDAAAYKATGRDKIDWSEPDVTDKIHPNGHINTLRAPDGKGVTHNEVLNRRLVDQSRYLSTGLYQLLDPPTDKSHLDWDIFANHDLGTTPATSLESWHDRIHVLVGGGNGSKGHMIVVEVASYDPVFWLHHNNIERMFALYQAMYDYPDQKERFVPETVRSPNVVDSSSQLAPFEKSPGKCYDSSDIRDWMDLGFAIPGNKPLDEAGRKAVAEYIRETYFWQTENSRPPKSLTYPRNLDTAFSLHGGEFVFEPPKPVKFLSLSAGQVVRKEFAQDSSDSSTVPVNVALKDEKQNELVYPPGSFINREVGKMYTWDAQIKVRKYAFNNSFVIQLFIGKGHTFVSQEPWQHFTDESEVGFSGVFAGSTDAGCANCFNNSDRMYGDAISITMALARCLRGNNSTGDWPPAELRTLESLDPEHVVPFLKEHLEWLEVDAAGNSKTNDEVLHSALEIVVASRIFTFPTDQDPLGSYGEVTRYPEATQGKIGGSNV